MSAIAFTPSLTRLNAADVGSMDPVLFCQFSMRALRTANRGNLFVGKFGVPVLKTQWKAVLFRSVFQVVSVSALKEMIWVKAFRIIALVADKDFLWNFLAMRKGVHEAMGTPLNAFMINKAIPGINLVRSLPFPTAIRCNLTVIQHPFHNWLKSGFMAFLDALSPIRHVVVLAKTSANDRRIPANLTLGHAASLYKLRVSSISLCHTQGR